MNKLFFNGKEYFVQQWNSCFDSGFEKVELTLLRYPNNLIERVVPILDETGSVNTIIKHQPEAFDGWHYGHMQDFHYATGIKITYYESGGGIVYDRDDSPLVNLWAALSRSEMRRLALFIQNEV